METVSAPKIREAGNARHGNWIARMTGPLLGAFGRDEFVRDGAAPEPKRPGLLGALQNLPAVIRETLQKWWNDLLNWTGSDSTWMTASDPAMGSFGNSLWDTTRKLLAAGGNGIAEMWNNAAAKLGAAWQKCKDAASWVADKAVSAVSWAWQGVSKIFRAVFRDSASQIEARRDEERRYEKRYQERKDEARRADVRFAEVRHTETRAHEASEIGRSVARKQVAALQSGSVDQVSAPPPGAEKYQIVDNGTVERVRVRKLLTGMLTA